MGAPGLTLLVLTFLILGVVCIYDPRRRLSHFLSHDFTTVTPYPYPLVLSWACHKILVWHAV